VRATRLLASPWLALHRNPARIQSATFGTFDGATSSYGVTFAMFAQHQHPVAFVAPIVGLAIASAAGMGGGEAASGEGEDLGRRAVVMAVASIFGVIVVALPFFYLHGVAALVISLALAVALGIAIALRRSGDLGRRKAWILTFGVLAVAIGVTSAVAVLLPGAGG
jgi:VIT1/CCC1 family predicted Fe2+/Mn2+ transporter